MKMKRGLFYLIYAVVLFGYLLIMTRIIIMLSESVSSSNDFMKENLIQAIIYIVLGVLLGSIKFITQRKKQGKWKVNFPKLAIVGIPALYFSLQHFIIQFIHFPYYFLVDAKAAQIILGFILITSFDKEKNPL